MPSNGDQMYTFQLDSEAAERVNDGHYKVVLNPQLELPLLAEPQAMVRSVVFSTVTSALRFSRTSLATRARTATWTSFVPTTAVNSAAPRR